GRWRHRSSTLRRRRRVRTRVHPARAQRHRRQAVEGGRAAGDLAAEPVAQAAQARDLGLQPRGLMATSIRKIIDENADRIVDEWEAEARKSVAAQGLTRAELVNRLPAFLASLLRSEGASADPNLVSQRWLIDSHLADRLRQGFELPEMVEEFHILGRCLEATWSGREEAERPAHAEIKRMHEEIRRATSAAMALFGENLIQYQQAEKRFLRRLHKVAADSIGDDAIVPTRVGLRQQLEVISDALKAETTGLYF